MAFPQFRVEVALPKHGLGDDLESTETSQKSRRRDMVSILQSKAVEGVAHRTTRECSVKRTFGTFCFHAKWTSGNSSKMSLMRSGVRLMVAAPPLEADLVVPWPVPDVVEEEGAEAHRSSIRRDGRPGRC